MHVTIGLQNHKKSKLHFFMIAIKCLLIATNLKIFLMNDLNFNCGGNFIMKQNRAIVFYKLNYCSIFLNISN